MDFFHDVLRNPWTLIFVVLVIIGIIFAPSQTISNLISIVYEEVKEDNHNIPPHTQKNQDIQKTEESRITTQTRDCSRRTCGTFVTQSEAQRFFEECGATNLDRDKDGIACEALR